MKPYYSDDLVTLYHGDCLEVLRTLPDASVDAVATDPPYGLEFMGRDWDAPWKEKGINSDAAFHGVIMADGAPRLPRPSYTGSTNPNCMSCGGKQRGRRDGTALVAVCVCPEPRFPNVRAVEMRAFQDWCEIWAGECLRVLKPGGHMLAFGGSRTWHRLASAVEDSGFEIRDSIAWLYGSGFPKSRNLDGEWEGWGTALKPAFEPIVVGRKPLAGTVAANVLTHGTGALNIAASRVGSAERPRMVRTSTIVAAHSMSGQSTGATSSGETTTEGRWPTNVVLDESQAAALDDQTGILTSGLMKARTSREPRKGGIIYGADKRNITAGDTYADSGGASRFFPTFRYEAKAPTSERPTDGEVQHPTVKPLDLMRWLVRLVTPPNGVILEPFAGSGTTVEAALLEGFRCIAIEREADYLPLIEQRIHKPLQQSLFGDWDGAA